MDKDIIKSGAFEWKRFLLERLLWPPARGVVGV
jgi:hypothetical protein